MTDRDVLDPEVERYLRDSFAGDATRAPLPHDLAGGAVRRARAHRRRTAVGGSVMAVLMVALGVAVAQQTLSSTEGSPPAANESPSVPSGPALPTDQPVLMFRGVEVPVPAAMLAPENVHCGTPVADAAYVVDSSLAVDACAIPEPPDLTLVVMQPLEDVQPADRNPGGRTLADGRYEVASAIPGRDVWLTVTSPDKERADRLFGGAVIASSPKGCDVHPDPSPAPTSGGPVDLPPLSDGAIGRVCGYRHGWLTGAALLSRSQLDPLYDAVAASPSDALLDCFATPPAGTGWWVTIGQSKIWVEGANCARVIVDGGGSGRLTDTLAPLLWSLAPGPGTLEGVVSEKG